MSTPTNKARWRSDGNRQYIRIEARPARKDPWPGQFTCELDWLPSASSEAWEAFAALQKAVLHSKLPEEQEAFYKELSAFAEGWSDGADRARRATLRPRQS